MCMKLTCSKHNTRIIRRLKRIQNIRDAKEYKVATEEIKSLYHSGTDNKIYINHISGL